MRVLVTGAAGYVGGVVAKEFLEQGYTVRGLDKRPLKEDLRGRMEMVYADMTDRYGLLKAVEGCEAIAHLAAIPGPNWRDDEIFAVNVLGTQNLLDAAEGHGVKRVALASTCCTYGIYFALHPIRPHYLPIDEKHPVLPQDLYGLSKVLVEETAAAYTRRSGMTTASLRLTTVVNLARKEHLSHWRHGLQADYELRKDMWSYIEVRDAARAFRLAIENTPEGTNQTVIIAARTSLTACDIRQLVQNHYPELAMQVEHLKPSDSLYDTRAAEVAFGFVAERDWRDEPELADVTGPGAIR